MQWPTDIEATQLVKEGSAFRDDMLKILTAGRLFFSYDCIMQIHSFSSDSYAYVVGEPDLIRYIKPNSLPRSAKN